MRGSGLLFVAVSLAACGKSTNDDDMGGPPPPPPIVSARQASPRATAALPPEMPPAPPGVVAALDGLRDGDTLASSRVHRVAAIQGGMMPVTISANGGWATFDVCLFDAKGPTPPARSEKYAIYWRAPDPGVPTVGDDAMTAAAEALAARLRKSEKNVPTPPGVTAYVLEKKP